MIQNVIYGNLERQLRKNVSKMDNEKLRLFEKEIQKLKLYDYHGEN